MIPSWYPTQESPVTGRFFKEQALLYANEYQYDNVIISRWGQGEFIIDLFSPFKATKKLLLYWKAKSFKNRLLDNVLELYTPAIELRPRRYAGDISQIVKANIKNFERAINEYGTIHIIHAHVSFPAGFIAAKLSEHFEIPYVITEHMGPFPFPFYLEGNTLTYRLIEAFEKAQRVIAVSTFLKNEMLKYKIVVDEILSDFIDDDFFSPGESCVSDTFVFFALGRITKEKGIDTLIQAFALALKNQPEMVLRIGGEGADQMEMVDLAQKLGIDSKIEWLGELDISGVKSNLQQCSVFVCASIYETFGVVVSEALCCGKSILSTRCGGPEEMIDESNGMLVPIGDVSSMATAMCSMRSNIQKFDPVEIRLHHIKNFGKKSLMTKLRVIYTSVLDNQ